MEQEEIYLADQLALMTKDELIRVSNNLNIPINKSARKQVVANQMADYMMYYPLNVLIRVDLPSLIRLRQLVRAPHFKVDLPKYEILRDDLSMIGLAESFHSGEFYTEKVCIDFAMQITPFIDEFVEEMSLSKKIEKEGLIKGIINLYGIITLKNITTIYKKFDPQITIEEIRSVVEHSYSLKSMYNKQYDRFKECMISKHIQYSPSVIEERRFHNIKRFTGFTKEEILNMGSVTPIPPFQKMTELRQLFANLGYTVEATNYFLTLSWSSRNNLFNTDIKNDLLYHYTKGKNEKVDKTYYINLLTEYFNSIPIWALDGNSLDQVTTKCPSNSVDEKITNDDAVQLQHFMQTSSITENDEPCPCGSGKLFKVCCGNN